MTTFKHEEHLKATNTMKKLLSLFIYISFILFLGACSDDNDKNPLQGTKWELEGYVIDASDLKIMQPSDCKECYVLNFITDKTWEGKGDMNFTSGKLETNQGKMKIEVLGSSFGEISINESFYHDLLKKTTQYSIIENKLYLYAEDKANYLCYISAK